MRVVAPSFVDHDRLGALTRREEQRLSAPASEAMYRRAANVIAGGVTSTHQLRKPWPLYLSRAAGSSLWDVDGVRRTDYHLGFGAMVQGHAHPAIGRVLAERYGEGTQFGGPSEDAIVVAEELARRWGLSRWRFTNSGSESTMDAIRIARGFTGRDVVIKAFGAYHGHHDAVMVAMSGAPDELVDRFHLPSRPHGAGVPTATAQMTVAVPFNDADAMDRRIAELDREGRKPACVILEPATMFGVVLPEPGYVEAVREITREHQVVLIFDEVKSGLSVGPAGAVGRFGVVPDIVTLAKTLGGGLPSGAIGATEAIMSVVAEGAVLQVGTYNGNPLVMAAARANLFEVLTPAAFDGLDALTRRMVDGCRAVLSQHGAPGYADGLGARGFVTFSPVKVIDYATFAAHEHPAVEELRWLYFANRGIYLPPARPEQWTLSVAHTTADADAYVRIFGELVGELS